MAPISHPSSHTRYTYAEGFTNATTKPRMKNKRPSLDASRGYAETAHHH